VRGARQRRGKTSTGKKTLRRKKGHRESFQKAKKRREELVTDTHSNRVKDASESRQERVNSKRTKRSRAHSREKQHWAGEGKDANKGGGRQATVVRKKEKIRGGGGTANARSKDNRLLGRAIKSRKSLEKPGLTEKLERALYPKVSSSPTGWRKGMGEIDDQEKSLPLLL